MTNRNDPTDPTGRTGRTDHTGHTDRKAYLEQIKAKIDAWDDEIERLESQAREGGATGRGEHGEGHQQDLTELRRRRDEARSKLREAQTAGEAAWEDMKEGFESSWKSISNSFQDAARRLK